MPLRLCTHPLKQQVEKEAERGEAHFCPQGAHRLLLLFLSCLELLSGQPGAKPGLPYSVPYAARCTPQGCAGPTLVQVGPSKPPAPDPTLTPLVQYEIPACPVWALGKQPSMRRGPQVLTNLPIGHADEPLIDQLVSAWIPGLSLHDVALSSLVRQ